MAGKSNKEIAQALNIAEGTVKLHLAGLFRLLGADNRAHAAALGKQLTDRQGGRRYNGSRYNCDDKAVRRYRHTSTGMEL